MLGGSRVNLSLTTLGAAEGEVHRMPWHSMRARIESARSLILGGHRRQGQAVRAAKRSSAHRCAQEIPPSPCAFHIGL